MSVCVLSQSVCSCECVQSIRINLYPQLFEAPHRPVVPVSPSVCVCVCVCVCVSATLLPCCCSVGGSLWSPCVGQFGQSVTTLSCVLFYLLESRSAAAAVDSRKVKSLRTTRVI